MSLDVKKAGILFPGQGAQNVGMGRWLCETYPTAKKLFDEAGEILGYDLAQLCQDGPAEKLNQTEFSQPALFVVGMAAANVLAEHHPERIESVVATAGLSLGEYTAVCFAGGLDFPDALRLVHRRGVAMQAAADAVDSGMASVLGMSLQEVQKLCDDHRGDGEILQPANLLCSGNIAVSGHTAAVDRLEASGAKAVRLAVAGAFHTPLMQPAVQSLQEALAEMPIRQTRIPVYSNVDAKPHQAPDEIRDLLSRQVVQPVQWEASIEQMIDDGIEGFLEAGTGKVLRGILKRIDKFGRKGPTDGFGDGD
ncbi:ACP S-malonyltransferase [Stieleria varia]|uniref:Malonyl CoA-acyl carrier protein transacylase n=1 Tax=Stieleria varia TaxID=2528005 RepID=A0A5C6A0A0_9BACT|nr:ACP S-malonyltransferase [Stieleria varia]TWT92750.1 Malonyl CoA-acyl carrier protein transacylase [Stieleria varia]